MIASRAALPTGEPLTVQERAVLEEVVDVLACDVEGARALALREESSGQMSE